jgi:two-component system phosphate regulon sensor histidine kinase PhoR
VLARAVNKMAAELAERVRDVTREAALREQILAAMDEGVVLHDGGHVVYANPAATRFVGASSGDAIPPILAEAGDEPRRATLHHPNRRDLEVVTIEIDPSQRVSVITDITTAKRIEVTRRDFVANASHEMKTPVAGILATAETLRHAVPEDPERARAFIETLVAEARRLSRLINDLLSLARLEQAEESAVEIVDLSAVVEEVVERWRPQALAHEQTLEASVPPGAKVKGWREDLDQMVSNLIDNAISYTPSAGTITVTLVIGERIVLSVNDTGDGIPTKALDRIFERFFRVDTARSRSTGGTGLGLAIVRHVAERHAGQVVATSELGAGSTFVVTLPAA